MKELQAHFIGVKEVARISGLAASTIYKLTSAGNIPHYKPRGRLMFKEAEIIAWIEESKVELFNPKTW